MAHQTLIKPYSMKWLIGLVLILIFSMTLINHTKTVAHADTKGQIMVSVDSLNVRSLPSINGDIVQIAHKGDLFKVTQTQGDWDQIQLLNTQTGWVNHHYVQSVSGGTTLMVLSKVKGLNVHQSADLSSPIMSHLTTGVTYQILNKKGDLIQVASPDGPGWVTSRLVKPLLESDGSNQTASVTAQTLNIRQLPDLTSPITGFLQQGASIQILSETNGWAKIINVNGSTGWVSEQYLKMDRQTPKEPVTRQNQTSDVSTNGTEEKSSILRAQSIPPSNNVLQGKTIVLDPGHGGIDNGTTSVLGTHEKDLTLQTAKLVAAKLSTAGAHVILTRTDDTYVSLDDRVKVANDLKADAFISFHYNSSVLPFIKGITSYYYTKSKDQALAADLVTSISGTTGVSSRGDRFNNLHVLRENAQPCTLIELGFVSNKAEDQLVETDPFREQVAEGVYEGLVKYFSTNG